MCQILDIFDKKRSTQVEVDSTVMLLVSYSTFYAKYKTPTIV